VSAERYPRASLRRRLASLFYEILVAGSLLFVAAFAFSGAATGPLAGWARHGFQAYLFGMLAAYFIWSWVRGGQTLPMKTWRIKVLNKDNQPLGTRVACIRYLAGWVSTLTFGAGFLWAVFDRDRQFLHDRLAGTRIVRCEPSTSAPPTTS
jgi:uncharacterized RDD family membrane protein YckC